MTRTTLGGTRWEERQLAIHINEVSVVCQTWHQPKTLRNMHVNNAVNTAHISHKVIVSWETELSYTLSLCGSQRPPRGEPLKVLKRAHFSHRKPVGAQSQAHWSLPRLEAKNWLA